MPLVIVMSPPPYDGSPSWRRMVTRPFSLRKIYQNLRKDSKKLRKTCTRPGLFVTRPGNPDKNQTKSNRKPKKTRKTKESKEKRNKTKQILSKLFLSFLNFSDVFLACDPPRRSMSAVQFFQSRQGEVRENKEKHGKVANG